MDKAISTRIQYNRVAMGLAKRLGYDLSQIVSVPKGGKISENDFKFYEAVIDLARDWKPKTWRLNKAALIYYFERINPELARMFEEEAKPVTQSGSKKDSGRTSSTKKGIGNDDFNSLRDELLSDMSKPMQVAAYGMLLGGIKLGLRPTEWSGIEFIEQSLDEARGLVAGVAVISNHKTTNERGNGEHRKIKFALRHEDFSFILRVTETISFFSQRFGEVLGPKKYYERVGRVLLDARKKVLKGNNRRMITFYSARHQFSADAKSAGLSEIEIAALMGHRSLETAKSHYGKRRVGNFKGRGQEFRQQASPHEETIKSVISLLEERGKLPDYAKTSSVHHESSPQSP